MARRISIFWIILATLLLTSIVPLLAVAATDEILIGIVMLAILVAGSAFVLASVVGRPVNLLSVTAKTIESSIEKDTDFPDLDGLEANYGREIADLTDGFKEIVNAFQKRLTQLDSIHAISQTITSSTLDYEKTVKAVLAAVQKVVDYDATEVAVLHGNRLTVEAWWGKDGFKDTTGRRYKVGKGPTGTIAETKKPLYIATVQDSTEDLQRTIGYASLETEFIAKTTKLMINSFLGIPLLIGDRLIGTLTLVHHKPAFFTDDDKRQLNTLADHASIAIDNALKVREREDDLKNQIRELRIEIDQSKLSEQVEEVTETDYFRSLQASAARMRERHNQRSQQQGASDGQPMSETESQDTTES
jgi:transcriptional regulator with GAF, ATPase, and Fis domain